MSFECGQQRVMRLGWERPRSLALRRVLTNRMREYFTYGSVGGAGGNPGSYPAANRRPAGQSDGSGKFLSAHCSRSASPAAVAELGSLGRMGDDVGCAHKMSNLGNQKLMEFGGASQPGRRRT